MSKESCAAAMRELLRGTCQRTDRSVGNDFFILERQKRINELVWKFSGIEPRRDSYIFDLCCGSSGLFPSLKDRGRVRYVGVDISPCSLAEHPAAEGVRGGLVVGNAWELPFRVKKQEDKSEDKVFGGFDAVFAVMAFHSLYNLPQTVSEIRRVLKMGSRLVVAENGIRIWDACLLLYCLEKTLECRLPLLAPKQRQDCEKFFQKREEVKPAAYLEIVARSLFNKTPGEILSLASGFKKRWGFFQELQRLYFANLDRLIQANGFRLLKLGKIEALTFSSESKYEVQGTEKLSSSCFSAAYQENSACKRLQQIKTERNQGPRSLMLVLVGVFQREGKFPGE